MGMPLLAGRRRGGGGGGGSKMHPCSSAACNYSLHMLKHGHTWRRKYRYAARENTSQRKMGRNVMRLYLAVLMSFPTKPSVGSPALSRTALFSAGGCFFCSQSTVVGHHDAQALDDTGPFMRSESHAGARASFMVVLPCRLSKHRGNCCPF